MNSNVSKNNSYLSISISAVDSGQGGNRTNLAAWQGYMTWAAGKLTQKYPSRPQHAPLVNMNLCDPPPRADSEHSKEVVRPYDWTYTTDYRGTLIGEGTQIQVTETTERIDMEKLKAREQIMFFDDRVMPTSFFLLLRFFLRVDGAGKNYMLREFSTRESKIAELKNVPPALYTDPNEIAQHLDLKLTVCEKLELPVTEPQTTADEDRQ
ncbi:hypothetical protein INR49_016101 [Caranx melampygus]|nr:hypothetical protein INR49_016101 [Caranx melampygus]